MRRVQHLELFGTSSFVNRQELFNQTARLAGLVDVSGAHIDSA